MRISFFSITLLLWVLCFRQEATSQTVNFYLTPSLSKEVLAKQGDAIKRFMEAETGLTIKLVLPGTYDELVNSFGDGKQNFAIMSSQSYVLANKKYGATVKLRTIRYGQSVYYGQIITKATSGIKSVQDINKKTMAYTDELSTSGYLFPKQMLDKQKVVPAKVVFGKTHDEVVRMVYEGKVDAGATFYSPPTSEGVIRDARSRLKTVYPDVEKKVVIIAKTEPIPNDPIVFSKTLDPETARKLYVALVKFSTDEAGKKVLLELYGAEGFVRASDADYNSVRKIMGD